MSNVPPSIASVDGVSKVNLKSPRNHDGGSIIRPLEAATLMVYQNLSPSLKALPTHEDSPKPCRLPRMPHSMGSSDRSA
jgi:hypothetical protein